MNKYNSYELKISIKQYPYVKRTIKICGNESLDKLSDVILSSVNFDRDHMYLFNMDNKKYSENAYVSGPMNGKPSTKILIEKLNLSKNQKFLYLFDFGEEWVFNITVRKIEEAYRYRKPEVIESMGEVEQYPDYDEEEGISVYVENSSNFTTKDILKEIEDELIFDQYIMLFHNLRSYEGKDVETLRKELEEEVLSNPGLLCMFLPNKQIELLKKLVKQDDSIQIEERCDLMKLYSFGFCNIEEDEYEIVVDVPDLIINQYGEYLSNKENCNEITKYQKIIKMSQYYLSKYVVVELDRLYEIVTTVTETQVNYSEYVYMIQSRLDYFGTYILFEYEGTNYLSWVSEEETIEILSKRKSNEKLNQLEYVVYTKEHCEKAVEGNFYEEYAAYRQWWEYIYYNLSMDGITSQKLLAITTKESITHLKGNEAIIKESKELFRMWGCRFTQKAKRLIETLMEEMPCALYKGRTEREYTEQS